MRLLKIVFALTLLALAAFPVAAQDTALEFGQEVTGEISDREFEFEYTFAGEEGQLVSIRMSPTEGSELDPEVYLYTADNDLLAANDDFSFPTALILYTLPASGEYTLVATRNDGRSGSTSGEFALEVSIAESLAVGSTIEATYSTDFFTPNNEFYLLAPAADGEITLSYAQDSSNVYAAIRVVAVPDWTVDPEFSFYQDVLWLGNSSISNAGSITLNVEAGRLYILRAEFGGYGINSDYSAEEGTVSITLE